MAYTTAQIDSIISTLQISLASGAAEVTFENRKITYRSTADIRTAIGYFNGLYPSASDAPAVPVKKTRTFFGYSNPGFGNF